MRWRRLGAAAVLLVAVSGCSDQLGRDVPECRAGVTNSIVMEIQSVATAAWVPCIYTLDVGWVYHDLEPRRGLAEFSLGSDRMGEEFLTIRTTASCDISSAESTLSDEGDIALYKDVVEDSVVRIVVIPEGDTEETKVVARSIAADLFGTRIGERQVEVEIDRSDGTTTERVASAHRTGAHVLSVSIRGAEQGTVSLLLARGTEEVEGTVRHAVDAIEDATGPPTYLGSWYYVFDGGCTEYRFDARGPGVESVAGDVQQSLGFIDAEAVKSAARQAGYEIP